MAQPESGFVEIYARDGGKLLSHNSTNTSHKVAINPPSLVKIDALPDAVPLASNNASSSSDDKIAGRTVTPATGASTLASGAPSLIVTKFTGDGVLSADERQSDQHFNGTSSNIAVGSTLTVMLNGHSYATQIASDGSWSVTLPAGDLQALPDGSNTISISFANGSGGTSTANKTITVEPLTSAGEPPHPTIDQPFGDGILNAVEQGTQQTLSGTTGSLGSGQTVVVTLGEETLTATVDNDGNWSLSPDPYVLFQMGQGEKTITVTATDGWGQQGSSTLDILIDTQEPRIAINEISADNIIDASESASDLIISGTASWTEAGREMDLLFNGTTWHTQVSSSGGWSLTIPASAIQGLPEGVYNVRATLTDEAGNSTYSQRNITFATSEDTLPSLAIDPISTDDAVSYREGIYGLEMWGTSSHLPYGTEVTLSVDGKTFTGSVGGSDGIWRVSINDSELATIQDGNYTFTFSATDPNGNSTSATRDVLLLSHYTSKIGFTVDDINPADVSVVDGQEYVTLSGTIADTFPIKSVSLMVDDYPRYDASLTEEGHWSVTVPLSSSNIADGLQNIIFETVDGANNWVEQVGQIHVDLGHSSATALSIASLGLSGTESDLADAGSTLSVVEQHTATDSIVLPLSAPEGGVWSPSVVRSDSALTAESYQSVSAGSESTLADMLAQHQLQVHVV